MYYSEDIVEEVRDRNDVVDVISGYVNLKRRGSNYFGLCPFHGEKTASFSVNRSKQMFYCFGCHRGGSVINFIQEYENLTFPEAVEELAERAGIRLPQRELSDTEKREQSLKTRILEINTQAARYYYYCLRDPVGEAGLKYFRGRGLSDETLHSFGLGFAASNSHLVAYLRDKGFSDEEIVASGLAVNREKRGLTELFWNRVMFPILSANKKVIGFGGRVMGDGKPKYVNSPETPVYIKGRNLYGLFAAKQSREDHFILCEGYMDVIALHQAGFTQAVGILGTAFTPGQASLVSRYVKKVLLITDSDEPGRQAALKIIPVLHEAGIGCRVVDLSPCKDPDELIKSLGREEFASRLDRAENSLYFELRMLSRGYNLSDPGEKARFIHLCCARLAGIEDDIEREGYVDYVAAKYGTARELIERDVARAMAGNENIRLPADPRSGAPSKKEEDGLTRARRYLLWYLTEEPGLFSQISPILSPEDFGDPLSVAIAEKLYEQLSKGSLNVAAITDAYADSDQLSEVAGLFSIKAPGPDDRSELSDYLSDLVIKIKKQSILHPPGDGLSDPGPDGAGGDALGRMRLLREKARELDSFRVRL